MGREKVLLRAVPDYNPTRIKQVIQEGLEEFGLSGAHHSDITIKPNVVMAHHRIAPSAFTRSEFLDGLIQALHDGRDPSPKITITEKCGAGIPTSRMFRRAGYFSLKKKHHIKLLPIEESKKKKIHLQKGKIHNRITTSRKIADNDFLIYTPWKSPWVGIISRNMDIRWALSSWPQIPWLMIRFVPTCFA